jgi:hypothetical protein
VTESTDAFESKELREIAERAMSLARNADDPSLRIAFALFGESALNLAAKLPQPRAAGE